MARAPIALCAIAAVALAACSTAQFRPRAVGQSLSPNEGGDTLLAEARMQYDANNVALAISTYRRVLRTSPGSVQALSGLAASYNRMGRTDLADRYYQEALAIAPDNVQLAQDYADWLRGHGGTPAVAASTAAVQPLPLAPGTQIAGPNGAVTIVLGPEEPELPRLERISTAEVELVTRPSGATVRASPAQARNRSAALPGRPLPIQLVRSTGQQIVWNLGPDPEEARPHPAPTRILNAVGRRGQAVRMEHHLRAIGWQNVTVGDASMRRRQSVIFSGPGTSREGGTLARSLPFRPRVVISPRLGQLVLVLGNDAVGFDNSLRQRPHRS